jgi:serine/threonine protein kinase
VANGDHRGNVGGNMLADATLDDEPPVFVRGPDRVDLPPGTSVGRYLVLQRIGAGGMGVVYAAFDPELDRKVALKLLQADALEGERTSRGHARLVREAQAMAKLSHPNVVAVHDVGTFGSRVFVAMEFVAGTTLTQWMETPRPWRETVEMFILAGRGLAAAHAQGLVHRDFKPDNVLVGDSGRPRVLDFGLARRPNDGAPDPIPLDDSEAIALSVHDAAAARSEVESLSAALKAAAPQGQLTVTGTLAGTPAYMAPEQYLRERLDARTDQFSFCVALWEALYGARPFSGTTRPALAMAVCRGQIQAPPETADVPARVQRILRRGLALSRAERFADMGELLEALAHDPERDRRRTLRTAGLVALPLAVAAAAWWPKGDPCADTAAAVDAVWNDDTRQAVRAGFAATETSFAEDAARGVLTELDRYARGWAAAQREACEATHVHHAQSSEQLALRTQCLDERLTALDATATAFAHADGAAVRRAARAVDGLPALDDCADIDRLEVELALPQDPEVAARVAALRKRGAELDDELRLRGVPEDPEIYARYLDDVRATGHAPLGAEANFLVALTMISLGRAEDAQARLEEALGDALASDHDRLLARILTRLAYTAGVLRSRYDEGIAWGRQANGAVRALGPDTAEATDLASVMCKLLADKGDTDEALPQCDVALDGARQRNGDDHLSVAAAHEALGIAYYHAEQDDAALAEFTVARDAFARIQGEHHPDVARIQNSLAAICFSKKGAAPCREEFVEALDLSVAALGPDHPQVADFSNNLALVLTELEEPEALDQAERYAGDALRIRRELSDEEHPGLAASLRILGIVARLRGDHAGAEAHFREALGIARRTRGDEHHDVYVLEQHLGQTLDARGDSEGAREHWSIALHIAERTRSPDDVAQVRASLAAVGAAVEAPAAPPDIAGPPAG